MGYETPYLEWDQDAWELGTNYQSEEWGIWLNKHYKELPKPLWQCLGQKVEFEFVDNPPTIIGEIRRIGLFFNCTEWQISYDIYANGHARTVYDENKILRYIK